MSSLDLGPEYQLVSTSTLPREERFQSLCKSEWRREQDQIRSGKKVFIFRTFPEKSHKSRKSQNSGHPFYCVHSWGLWSGFINPPNIWTALFGKETYMEKPLRLKCSEMLRIWKNNPLQWFLSISQDYWFYFEKVPHNSNSERVRRIERLFLLADLILRPAWAKK